MPRFSDISRFMPRHERRCGCYAAPPCRLLSRRMRSAPPEHYERARCRQRRRCRRLRRRRANVCRRHERASADAAADAAQRRQSYARHAQRHKIFSSHFLRRIFSPRFDFRPLNEDFSFDISLSYGNIRLRYRAAFFHCSHFRYLRCFLFIFSSIFRFSLIFRRFISRDDYRHTSFSSAAAAAELPPSVFAFRLCLLAFHACRRRRCRRYFFSQILLRFLRRCQISRIFDDASSITLHRMIFSCRYSFCHLCLSSFSLCIGQLQIS